MRPPGVSSGKPFELPAEMRSPGVSRGRNLDSSVATGLGERAIGGDIEEGTGRVTDIRGGGVGRVGDGDEGGGGERVAPAVAGAGVMGSGVGKRSEGLRAVKSVASPGGDRLQRLAMAEIGFAEKELYAHKTSEEPLGPRWGSWSRFSDKLLCRLSFAWGGSISLRCHCHSGTVVSVSERSWRRRILESVVSLSFALPIRLMIIV